MYSVLAFFGQNLVIVENDDWKRHRKVVQSSFSEGAFPLVWARTKSSECSRFPPPHPSCGTGADRSRLGIAVIGEMTREEGWNDLVPGESFVINHVHDLTLRVRLWLGFTPPARALA